jgi:hypothetical protein
MTASVVLTGVLALKHWGDARSATCAYAAPS